MSTKAHPITEVLYEYLRTESSDFEPYDFNELKLHKDLYDRYVSENRKRLAAQWDSVLKLFFMDSFKPILDYTNATPFTEGEKDTIITLMTIYCKDHPALKYLRKVLSKRSFKDEEYRTFIKNYMQIDTRVLDDVSDSLMQYPYEPIDSMALHLYEEESKRTTFRDIFPNLLETISSCDYDNSRLLEIGRISLKQLVSLIDKRIVYLSNAALKKPEISKEKNYQEKEIINLFLPLVKEDLLVKGSFVLFRIDYEEYHGAF